MADTRSAFCRRVVTAFGAGNQLLGAFDGGVEFYVDGAPGTVTFGIGGFVADRVLIANVVRNLRAKRLDFIHRLRKEVLPAGFFSQFLQVVRRFLLGS